MILELIFANIEWIGAFLGLVGIVLASLNKISNWFFNILSALLYAYFFYNEQLYSDAGLQFVFIGMSVFGWINWNKDTLNQFKNDEISYLSRDEILQCVVITLLVWRGWYWLLPIIKPDQAFLFLDTLTTCISITAIILQAKRKVDSWIWWLVANCMYTPLFFYRGYVFTGVLYAIFIVLSVIGYLNWRRIEKKV